MASITFRFQLIELKSFVITHKAHFLSIFLSIALLLSYYILTNSTDCFISLSYRLLAKASQRSFLILLPCIIFIVSFDHAEIILFIQVHKVGTSPV